MKAIKCEMCNSTDLVKENGLYVCQCCGTKYSVEEAKKLLVEIEGIVNVKGSVKIDNSDNFRKYAEALEIARVKGDCNEMLKYCDKILEIEPQNVMAMIYNAYAQAKLSLNNKNVTKRTEAFRLLKTNIMMLEIVFDVSKEEGFRKIFLKMDRDINTLVHSHYEYHHHKDSKGYVVTDMNVTEDLFREVCESFANVLISSGNKIPEEKKKLKISYYNIAIKYLAFVFRYKKTYSIEKKILELKKNIVELEPDYEFPKEIEKIDGKDGIRSTATIGMVLGIIAINMATIMFCFLSSINDIDKFFDYIGWLLAMSIVQIVE